jgi:predicted outer membrane repeat protein
MKKMMYLLTVTLLIGFQSIMGQISGNLTSYLVGGHLLSGSYTIIGHTFLPSSSTAIIDPGVILEFSAGTELEVMANASLIVSESTHFKMMDYSGFIIDGNIEVLGMSGLNAVFEKAPSAVFGWNGFILDGALTSFFKLNYCEVSGIVKSGSTPSKSNGGFYINNRMFTNFEVLNSTFENNSVTNNGGVFYINNSQSNTPFLFDNNSFTGNTSNNGGALYLNNQLKQLIILKNNFIENNCVTGDGGAISLFKQTHSKSFTVLLNTFKNNKAFDGGAISSKQKVKNIDIFNNLFVENSAGNRGGGVFFRRGFSFINNTFSANNAILNGGALFAVTTHINSNGIKNNIFWADVPNETNLMLSAGHTYPLFSYCDINDPLLWGSSTNITTNPQFVSTTDFRLQSTSPCINAGVPFFTPTSYLINWTTDLDLSKRVQSAIVDMGAYERKKKKTYNMLSIENHKIENEFTIYPNPTNSVVNIDFSEMNDSPSTLNIYDSQGKRIINISDIQDQLLSIDMSDYDKGIYFIVVENNNKIITKKLNIN